MPKDLLGPSGNYKVRKRFRNEDHVRKKKDMPWSKNVLNLEQRQIFGRNELAWTRIIGFYLVLYALICLILLFWLAIFYFFIINPDTPRWLKDQPGLSVVPSNTSTIKFYSNILTEIYPIADIIDKFMDDLDKENDNSELAFAKCNKDKLWGYKDQQPCIFLKLNKVIGFKAKTYDSVDELPNDTPGELSKNMNKYAGKDRIWLTCKVKNNAANIVYIPGPYFDTQTSLTGFERVVGLQLNKMPENEVVSVLCRIWAKNIEIDTDYQGTGNAKFTIKMLVKY